MQKSFSLTDEEQVQSKNFKQSHFRQHGNRINFAYLFQDTAHGTLSSIVCPICQQQELLTAEF